MLVPTRTLPFVAAVGTVVLGNLLGDKMAKKLSREVKKAISDGKWWKQLGRPYGWRLIGFTYRQSALFGWYNYTASVDGMVLRALLSHRPEMIDAEIAEELHLGEIPEVRCQPNLK